MDKDPSTATVRTPSSNFTGDVWMNPVFAGDGTSQLTDEQYLAAHRTAGV